MSILIPRIIELEQRELPEGSITAWLPGYFGNSSNGSFASVLSANTIAGANAYLNSKGYYVCDGSELNNSESTIFAGSGRYLPNLTDDRFLMGDTTGGSTGGSNTLVDHTHSYSLTTANDTHSHTGTTANDTHSHTPATGNAFATRIQVGGQLQHAGAGAYWNIETTTASDTHNHTFTTANDTHNHSISGTVGTGSAATSTESRPKYLSVFYIMKIK